MRRGKKSRNEGGNKKRRKGEEKERREGGKKKVWEEKMGSCKFKSDWSTS